MTQPQTDASHPLSVKPGPPSRSSTLQNIVAFARKRAWILAGIAFLFVAAMVIGIVFVAHDNFHRFGGQGFLRARDLHSHTQTSDIPLSRLPSRRFASRSDGSDRTGLKRSANSVPFLPCGDQQNSCEAYGQPETCCPVSMIYYLSSDTTSGVYCCNSNASYSDCQSSAARPPQCPTDTFECASMVGGGCCPTDSECCSNGCILFEGSIHPAPTTSTFTTTMLYTIETEKPQLSTDIAVLNAAGVITMTSTFTVVIGGGATPTATIAKAGEVAQRGEGGLVRNSMFRLMHRCVSLALMLVAVALGMAML